MYFPEKDIGRLRVPITALALTIAFEPLHAIRLTPRSASVEQASRTVPASKRMPDGKEWTTQNSDAALDGSYCYEDAEQNCRRYGRLYTWQAAQEACRSLGQGWRLPANDDWQQLAKHFGGLREESPDKGKAAYMALMAGGRSGFDAVFGGNRAENGEYARLEAHGFYWTASETAADTAWLYNFGRGGQSLNRHRDVGKQSAFSVRCVREY